MKIQSCLCLRCLPEQGWLHQGPGHPPPGDQVAEEEEEEEEEEQEEQEEAKEEEGNALEVRIAKLKI